MFPSANIGIQMQSPFPADDLDYVIAATFNHAIDMSGRDDQKLCHKWALKALELAEYVNDGGDMKHTLCERAVEMGLNQGPVA